MVASFQLYGNILGVDFTNFEILTRIKIIGCTA